MDAGGAFQVVANYDGQREPHRGYLSVSIDEFVYVIPNTRELGVDGNCYREYVYGHRFNPPQNQGWLPLHILALEEWLEQV